MKLFDSNVVLPRPYVGISGFESSEQAVRMRDALREVTNDVLEDQRPILKAGLMTCPEKLWGHRLPSWAENFPEIKDLDDMFPPYDTPGIINMLHYVDFREKGHVPRHEDFFYSLKGAVDTVRENVQVIQLDMGHWPDPGPIHATVHAHPHPLGVVLQVGKPAYKEANGDPKEIAERLLDYSDVIDGVLLDMSMGHGELIKASVIAPIIHEIKALDDKNLQKVKIVVAGGLSGEPNPELYKLFAEFGFLSTDAQASLHVGGDPKKPFDENNMRRYVLSVGAMFRNSTNTVSATDEVVEYLD